MESIINYKLKDFLNQSDELKSEYISLLKFSNPKETTKQLYNMKLKEVDYIKTVINRGSDESIIKIMEMVEGLDEESVLEMEIVEFFGIMVGIRKQLERIIQNEEKVLTPKNPSFKWEAVGGSEKMAKFGIYNTLDNLSGGDITKYEYIMDMDYSEVFTILYMRRVKDDLTAEMNGMKINK